MKKKKKIIDKKKEQGVRIKSNINGKKDNKKNKE